MAFAIEREDSKGRVTLRLEGCFDALSAQALRASVEALVHREVVLDFSRVREFYDLAIPVLTRNLLHPRLQVRGVGRHHALVFKCFGVQHLAPPTRSYWMPEDAVAM